MPKPNTLEVTITHNLDSPMEIAELFALELIALDWDRKGPDISSYIGRAKTDVTLFHEMRTKGAAVIAAYRKDRVIGWVEPGAEFVSHNGLLCLPLTRRSIVNAGASFLGNLTPRSCTVQRCHNRARGRLAALVLGTQMPRSVWSLHNRDVEWLVTNFLIVNDICACVWSGSRSYMTIDHAGVSPSRREVLAQTTVSLSLVAEKAKRLLELRSSSRDLLFFGPEASRESCPAAIRYYAIEEVFDTMDALPAGRWLINLMLAGA